MEIRALHAAELPRAFELDAEAFHSGSETREVFLRFVDPARTIGAFDGGRLIAMSGVLELAQFFGGRSVPMGGVASVAVAPEWRGRGIGKQVLVACIQAMARRGEAISCLWPAATALYRSLGWELGGSFAVRTLMPTTLRALPRVANGRVRPYEERDRAALRACYLRLAQPASGCLDRNGQRWDFLAQRWKDRTRFVFEGASGEIEGYLVYRQLDGAYSALGGDFQLAVDELVGTSREALQALWGLLGSWSTQVEQIVVRSGSDDPAFLVLPELRFRILAEMRWMTRVVDAPAAIAARGYARGLDLAVPLVLRDPLRPENDGSWMLEVAKGEGRLVKRSDAAPGPSLEINGLASLYTGYATPAQLTLAGLLTGGSLEQREALGAIFAGPTPFLLDEF